MLAIRRIYSKADKLKFVRFLWDVYANDPLWVPPLEMDRMKLIDEIKNPFYKHAEVAWFLAENDGKIVGRIAAIINRTHNEVHHDKTGFFGFFECINDKAVAKALFTEAENFLRSKGIASVQGPANPSSNDEFGLLVEGFDRPPVLLMTYNPKYYIDLIQAAGYGKAKDLYAWLLSTETSRSEKLIRVTTELQKRSGITIRGFDKKQFDSEVSKIKQLYNEAWEANWGFVPLTDEEFDFVAKDLKPIYDPNMILFAEKNGETIGFALSLPDINQAFMAGPRIPKGALNLPVGLWNLLTKKKAIDTVRIVILGLKKEYRGKGIDGMMYRETIDRAEKKGYKYGEASWILEDNNPMNRACEMMNAKKYKTYRIYEKQL
ncbi:MAG TPA: GNAT family N-acetyltransferase [Candidatus Kapabacteria bacterium]|nr:GNAT family N-acetyltransferase [Candidatus Kapabacteria bacterium]